MENKCYFNKKVGLRRLISMLSLSPVISLLPLPDMEEGKPSQREICVRILGKKG